MYGVVRHYTNRNIGFHVSTWPQERTTNTWPLLQCLIFPLSPMSFRQAVALAPLSTVHSSTRVPGPCSTYYKLVGLYINAHVLYKNPVEVGGLIMHCMLIIHTYGSKPSHPYALNWAYCAYLELLWHDLPQLLILCFHCWYSAELLRLQTLSSPYLHPLLFRNNGQRLNAFC